MNYRKLSVTLMIKGSFSYGQNQLWDECSRRRLAGTLWPGNKVPQWAKIFGTVLLVMVWEIHQGLPPRSTLTHVTGILTSISFSFFNCKMNIWIPNFRIIKRINNINYLKSNLEIKSLKLSLGKKNPKKPLSLKRKKGKERESLGDLSWH